MMPAVVLAGSGAPLNSGCMGNHEQALTARVPMQPYAGLEGTLGLGRRHGSSVPVELNVYRQLCYLIIPSCSEIKRRAHVIACLNGALKKRKSGSGESCLFMRMGSRPLLSKLQERCSEGLY